MRGVKKLLLNRAKLEGAVFVLDRGEMGPTLHEPPPTPDAITQWVPLREGRYYDEKTGLELESTMVETGRHEEMGFLDHLKLWLIRPTSECLAVTGKPPIPVRWG